MKIFKKVLSASLSIGMIFSATVSQHIFASGDANISEISASEIPTNLEECCLALDKILSKEEKDKIKQSSVHYFDGYLARLRVSPSLVSKIKRDWLYSRRGVHSALYKLLDDHGADFDGDEVFVMVGIILDNYRRYLNGEIGTDIEDLLADYYFNFYYFLDGDSTPENHTRENLKKQLEIRVAHKHQRVWSLWCTIL